MTKITYLGRQIHDTRDTRGRFKKARRLGFLLLIAVFIVTAFVFHPAFMSYMDNELSYSAPAQIAYASETMEAKVEKAKDDILNRLMQCESAGHSEDAGIIIFDANNKPSIGQFQFQKDTVVHYYKKIYGQDISKKEAVIVALDTEKARKLAHDIIWLEKGGVWNWENCANKTGIVPEITVLKKLEQ